MNDHIYIYTHITRMASTMTMTRTRHDISIVGILIILYNSSILRSYRVYSGQIITTSLFSLTGIMVNKGNHPQMAQQFRFVNYYNLPSLLLLLLLLLLFKASFCCFFTTGNKAQVVLSMKPAATEGINWMCH